MKRRLLLALLLAFMPRLAAADVCSDLPQSHTNLTGWWTADSISAGDGDAITTWADSSGSENTATSVGTTPVYKTGIVNSRPVVRFNGSGAFDLPIIRTTQTFTFLAVVKSSNNNKDSSVLSDATGGRDFQITSYPPGNQKLNKSYIVEIGHSTTSIGTAGFHVVTVTYDGTTARFYLDGAADGSSALAQVFSHSQTAHLGYAAVPTQQFFWGDIATAAQWNGVLPDMDRCAAIRCLGAEYGISVDESACPATPSPTPTATGTLTVTPPTVTNTPTHTPTPTPYPTLATPVIVSMFSHGQQGQADIYLWQTTDGEHFSPPTGCTLPLGKFPSAGGVGQSTGTAAYSLLHYDSKYWIAYEMDDFVTCHYVFGIMNTATDDICGPYTWVTDVQGAPDTGSHVVWNPRWFVDDDGSIHILATVGATCDSGHPGTLYPYMLDATNAGLTTWSAPTAIAGTAIPGNMWDSLMLRKSDSPNGQYNLWFVESAMVGYLSSTSRTSGYVVTKRYDWNGWVANNAGIEGPMLFKRTGTVWRVLLDIIGYGGGVSWSDSTDDWATWTSGLVGVSTDSPSIRPGNGSVMVEALSIGTNTPTTTPTRTPTPTGVINTATPTESPTPATFAGSSINRRFPNSHCCPAASPQCVTQDSPTYCTSDAECPVGDVCYKMPLSSSVIRDNFDAAADDIEALQGVIWPLNLDLPSLGSGCGASASIAGGDDTGKITIGTAPAGSCVVTFAMTRTTDPVCYALNETTGAVLAATATSSALTIVGTLSNGNVVKYLCAGR